MSKLAAVLQKFHRDERGVSAVEYAILAGIIIAAVAIGVYSFKESIMGIFSETATTLGDIADGTYTPQEGDGNGAQ